LAAHLHRIDFSSGLGEVGIEHGGVRVMVNFLAGALFGVVAGWSDRWEVISGFCHPWSDEGAGWSDPWEVISGFCHPWSDEGAYWSDQWEVISGK